MAYIVARNMNKKYRVLFLYSPLIAAVIFMALIPIPWTTFIPWKHFNIWTVFKAFTVSYVLLGFIAFVMKDTKFGIHLIYAGIFIFTVSVGSCLLAFDSLYYILFWSNTPAFLFILSINTCVGFLTLMRYRINSEAAHQAVTRNYY